MCRKVGVQSCTAAVIVAAIGAILRAQAPTADPARLFVTNDPACQAATLVSTGGQFPKNPHTLVIRWTGFSNYELAYNAR
jgi:hypothetical protein